MKIAISGPGTCGKDTLAIWLGANTSLRYIQSTSQYMAPMIFTDMLKEGHDYSSVKECYQDRYYHREYWAAWIDRFNALDPVAAYSYCLQYQDILTGIRKIREIKACKEKGLYDLGIWVERPGVPQDPTMEYGPEEMDLIILNSGTHEELFGKAERLFGLLGLLKCPLEGLTC